MFAAEPIRVLSLWLGMPYADRRVYELSQMPPRSLGKCCFARRRNNPSRESRASGETFGGCFVGLMTPLRDYLHPLPARLRADLSAEVTTHRSCGHAAIVLHRAAACLHDTLQPSNWTSKQSLPEVSAGNRRRYRGHRLPAH